MRLNPFFSIVVPVYQTEKFLSQCLDSILEQTYSNFELIVVNDASPDKSLLLLKQYRKKYPFLRIINFRKNQGVSAARNKGLKTARGEYVYFLDSDDFIAPNLLKKVHQRLEKTQLDCLICAAHSTNAFGEKQNRKTFWHLDFIPSVLTQKKFLTMNDILPYPGCIPANPSFIFYKRSFLIKHHLTYPNIRFEDLVFQTSVFFAGAKFSFLKPALIYYRQHEHSLFQSGDERFFDAFESCRQRAQLIMSTQNSKARLYFLNSKYILLRNLSKKIQKKLRNRFLKEVRQSLQSDNLTRKELSDLYPPASLFYYQIMTPAWKKALFFPTRLLVFILYMPILIYQLTQQYRHIHKPN